MRPEMIRQRLEQGISVECRGHGHSMEPVLKDGEMVRITPAKEARVGDMVFCKVRGYYYDGHWVKAKNPKRGYLIANNHGHVNGWTHRIYGIVHKISQTHSER